MQVRIEKSWQKALSAEFDSDYFEKLTQFVKSEYRSTQVYPPAKFIFSAFDQCPFDQVKVVILGQDPYHGPKQANGLSFSVNPGVALPPSLQNIFKELYDDLGILRKSSGDLSDWARQGVLLLNATLTVRANNPSSHQNKGWEQFTDAVIQNLSDQKDNLVFILWGRYAQDKGTKINTDKHLVIKSAHPSPFSAHSGFFGSHPFSQTNTFLILNGLSPINW